MSELKVLHKADRIPDDEFIAWDAPWSQSSGSASARVVFGQKINIVAGAAGPDGAMKVSAGRG
jgi:hypothetical protein